MGRQSANPIKVKAVAYICRAVIAVVFVYAALGKIGNPKEFADAVAAFRILPIAWVNAFAIVLPWIELLVGLALLSGTQLKQAAMLSVLLNIVFIVAASSAMARGLDIKCGCFTLSKAHSSIGWQLIARDTVFSGIGLLLLFLYSSCGRKKHWQKRKASVKNT
jgi:uncharacterized membrane protein YphA (DoxX/SURF4 family)